MLLPLVTKGLLGWFALSKRDKLSHKYLRGEGLEIGALAAPLRVFHGARVRYLDNTTRADSIAKFPELAPESIVEPEYLCDGFTMATVPAASQDFLIANHVLEHAPDPIGVLRAWLRVLRPGKIVYVSVPVIDECFDRGRVVTSVEHMLEDFQLSTQGRGDALRERNKEHYAEWLTISLPAIQRGRGQPADAPSPEALAHEVDDWSDRNAEIHFHTFTCASLRRLLERITTSDVLDASLVRIVDCGVELIAILRVRGLTRA
jgi:SAM-dependent methyltransferase